MSQKLLWETYILIILFLYWCTNFSINIRVPATCQNTTGWLVDSRMKVILRACTTTKANIRMEMWRPFWGYVMKWPAQNREGKMMTVLSCTVSTEPCRLRTGTWKTCGTFHLQQMTNAQSLCEEARSIQWFSSKVVREQNSGGDWGWRGKHGLDQGCRVWSKSKLWR